VNKAIEPDADLLVRLIEELGLTVDGPRAIPVGQTILHRHDAAGHDFARMGIAFADLDDIRNHRLIEGRDRRGHPVGFADVAAEFLGVAKAIVLRGDPPSTYPRIRPNHFQFRKIRGMSLIAIAGAIGAAAIGDEDQIIFDEVDRTSTPSFT
jgi:hypothetical protein